MHKVTMDTPLFQQDWQILEEDLLRAVSKAYNPLYASLIEKAIAHVHSSPSDIESLIAALDPLEDHDLQICARILGVLLESFSILQHVHKTRSFAQHSVLPPIDFHSSTPFELELFVTIHAHDTLALPIQSIFNRWFKIFSLHRHAKETPLTETLRKQYIHDCLAIFQCESFMQSLSLKEAFHHAFYQYNLHTLPGRFLLDAHTPKSLDHSVKIGFVIEVDLRSPQIQEILMEIPLKAFDCAWPLLTKNYPVLLPFKNIVQQAFIERSPGLWKSLPEKAPPFDIALQILQCSPIVISLSSPSLFSFLDNCVQKLFRKRLRRLLNDEQPFPSITPSHLQALSLDLSLEDRALLSLLSSLANQPLPFISDLIVSEIGDFDSLHAVDTLLQIYQLPQRLIPSFEHPRSIADAPQILQKYYHRLSMQKRPFPITKVLIGNQNHTKDKSFWWTHTQLYHAQQDLILWAQSHALPLKIIQSRGGSLARGSIPTRCLINSTLFSPGHSYLGLFIHPDAFRQRLNTKLTTEMTLWRYTKELIHCHNYTQIPPDIRSLQSSLADHSLPEVAYYTQEQPDLIDYFYSVTPAENLSTHSQSTLKNHRIEEINSTLWFGCWAQSRLLLPFWLGFGAVLLQWDRASSEIKTQLLEDRCIEALFLVTLISLYRVDLAILKAYERELLSHHLGEVGEHLQQRYDKVLSLSQKFIASYNEDPYVKNFKDDMLCRSCYLTPLHALQIQMLRRSRSQWPEHPFWRGFIRESMMFISLGLQNSV